MAKFTTECLHAFTLWNDDGDTLIIDFLTNDASDFFHVLWQWHHYVQVLTLHAQCQSDGLELVRTSRILSTRHGSSQIVADDHGDVGMVVHGIQQSRHTRVCEG